MSMWWDSVVGSRFETWSDTHEPKIGPPSSEHDAALKLLVECVAQGEITCLDGQASPVSRKILETHGDRVFEMNSNWVGSPQDWSCPCCGRMKFQISRVGQKGQILAKSVVHHDHMGDVLEDAFNEAFVKAGTNEAQVDGKKLIQRLEGAFSAYDAVLVCEDCNNADTRAKRELGLPKAFSFSINQIRTFIRIQPHQPHGFVKEAAQTAWDEAKKAFELRMKIVRAVAYAAVTDAHWYEPHARDFEPVPVYGNGRRTWHAISKWVSADPLISALGQQTRISKPNVTRWRKGSAKRGRPLPPNYVAIFRSEPSHAQVWDGYPADWRCPICQRLKDEIVYVSDSNDVRFTVNGVAHVWHGGQGICGHCFKVLSAIKAEAKSELNHVPHIYDHVSHQDIAAIIIPKKHCDHQIKKKEAEALMKRVIQSIDDKELSVSEEEFWSDGDE